MVSRRQIGGGRTGRCNTETNTCEIRTNPTKSSPRGFLQARPSRPKLTTNLTSDSKKTGVLHDFSPREWATDGVLARRKHTHIHTHAYTHTHTHTSKRRTTYIGHRKETERERERERERAGRQRGRKFGPIVPEKAVSEQSRTPPPSRPSTCPNKTRQRLNPERVGPVDKKIEQSRGKRPQDKGPRESPNTNPCHIVGSTECSLV